MNILYILTNIIKCYLLITFIEINIQTDRYYRHMLGTYAYNSSRKTKEIHVDNPIDHLMLFEMCLNIFTILIF